MEEKALGTLTVEEQERLLRLLKTTRGVQQPAGPAPILPVDRRGHLPLSFAQRRLWFLARLEGGSEAYHLFSGRVLRGRLDVPALRRALDRILARHEALRTTFALLGEEPVQRIAPEGERPFHLVELGLDPHADLEAELDRLVAQEVRAPFDLEKGPLVRGILVRRREDEHVLLITMHHIVSDGWSMTVFFKELSALYGAFRAGEADPLAPLGLQYADYAAWQRNWLAGDVLRRQTDYWRAALSGVTELLTLPTDHPRPAHQDFTGALVEFVLDEPLTRGLRALGRRHGATLFMVLLAAWGALLSRLSGQEDVVVGAPVANRTRGEIEGLIGFFVNTLALRVDLSGEPTVGELIHRVKQQALAAQDHQDLPFEQVVEIVRPARSLAHSPLFQAMLAWEGEPEGRLELSGLELSPIASDPRATAKFDLTLLLQEKGDRVVGEMEYATSLFDRVTIERHLGYLRNLLEGMVADDTRPVARLPLMAGEERRRVLVEWNATAAEYPKDACVHEIFEAQAERAPEAAALLDEERTLSYRELNARANALAHLLAERGVRRGDRVALLMERSIELVVAELAILKAGAAYVPIDPTHPAERISFLLEDSGAKVLVASAGWELPEGIGAARVDVEEAVPTPSTTENLRAAAGSEDAAYVMYTSGSTGLPKGVLVPHRAIGRLVLNGGYAEFGPGDRVAFAANPAFDATTMEVWGPLLNGGCLVVIDRSDLLDPKRFGHALMRHGVSILWLTVGLFNQYVDELSEAFSRLRYLIVGGDALDPKIIARALRNGPPQHLVNGYGPTETTTFAITHLIREVPEGTRSIPLGRPISNTQVYILDPYGEPVPVGVAGEIHIGGAGVALGYLNRPELSSERFVENPFAAEPGARMYRTGDLGRWRPDGTVEFLGRNDSQVKIRGFRIEPGEIEARLGAHEAVREAVVIVREDHPGDKRLVAYYVLGAEGPSAGVEALRAHLALSLPDYMVPSAYVRLDSLPLTANGKLDRRALPVPEGTAYGLQAYEAPEGELEAALAGIWADVLGVDRVGRHDNFFKLGGHSLLAVTLIERMRRMGMKADVRALFGTPTLAELARTIRGGSSNFQTPPSLIPPGCSAITPDMLPLVDLSEEEIARILQTVPGGASNVQDIYPLAPLQEGIFFHHLMATQGDTYLLSCLFSFEGRERLDAFLEALRCVVDRHDILRTAVVWDGLPEPVQVVWRSAPLSVEEVAVDPSAGDAAEQLFARFDPRRIRIDLGTAPMMRFFAARDEAQGRWLLLMLEHHLVGDHTTLDVMLAEIQEHLLGKAQELPAPLPFRNLVAQARLAVSREEHEVFFREMLGDVEEGTAPFGLTDVRGDGSRVEEAHLRLDRGLSMRLRAKARELGVSAASLCHLAWAQVLAKVSGRQDVVFGTVLFGRMQGGEGADRAMGLFINTLPVRIRLGEEGVEACLRSTQLLLAGLMRHEHASLSLAQRCSAVQAPAPLFSSLLNYRHSQSLGQPQSEESIRAWEGIETLAWEERTNYPLALAVDDLGEDFRLKVQARDPIAPLRVCEFMRTAMEGVVAALETAPGAPVGTLDVLPPAERRQVLETWNATEERFPEGACLHELFEAQAAAAPEAVALVQEGRQLSYGELNGRANRLAHRLRRLGVGPDARVAVCAERGFELVVALLAVLKAGGAYLPLDPDYPEDRLRFMIEDSAPVVLLAQGPLGRILAPTLVPALPVLDLEDPSEWADLPFQNLASRDLGLGPEHLAYVIYTSGSTGMPKGVMIEHRSIVNHMWWMQRAFPLRSEDSVVQKTPFSFDASVWEFFAPLLAGGRLVLAKPGGHRDADYLADLLRRESVHTFQAIPTLLEMMLDAPAFAACPSLRRMFCGGEALSHGLVERFRLLHPEVELINLYGPTEATIDATFWTCPPTASGRPSIGRPVSNTRIYLLDAFGQPVPVGVPGEIHVGGAGVARGYLNRPELSAERFVADPFAGAGARMYRTGDLGRWLPDGNVEFLGRNDFQVKVRGFRIELGEIEARLLEHPGVREAVVLAREDAEGQKRLVAYVTATEEGAASAEALRAHLSEGLPEYMVPAAYVGVEAWPLTPNGKVDRRALPAPEGEAFAVRAYEAPVGEVEEALAAIWAEVLKVDRVGRQDNFFELGGHSLLAVKVISRLRQAMGVEARVGDLFLHPVLGAFARRVEGAGRADLPALVPVERGERLPLSLAQQRLWFLTRLEGAKEGFHAFGGWRLRGDLDAGALRRALDCILSRHEALRTTFVEIDGEAVQRIVSVEEGGFELIEADLRSCLDVEGELERQVAEEARTSFDLERGPLVRGRLLRVAEEEHALLITLHHIVSDGWSMGVLFRELNALYGAFRRGEEDPLPPLGIQYADYAAWQRAWMTGEVLQRQAEFWKGQLSGVPELLDLPTDHPRPAHQDFTGALAELSLDEALTRGLKALSQRHGTTLYMTLLTAWGILLGRLSGQEDLVVGTPVANRGRAEIEGLIGFFVNTLALRLDLSGSPTVGELLKRVKARALEAQQHQDLPFEQVVEIARPVRSLSHSPLFQAMFAWQNASEGRLELPGLALRPVDSNPHLSAQFDLTLLLQERGGRIVGELEYATSLFERETVDRYLGYLRQVLEGMVADDTQRVDRLALMSEAERRRVLVEWNATEEDCPADLCVHELFEAQAASRPEAVALVQEGRALSYGELNEQANCLAHHLRELGVGPDARVAICLERGFEMVVALLAVLKAGGGYVPLDPALPAERLKYMVEDAEPVVLLTQAFLRERFGDLGAPILDLDSDAARWATQPTTNPERKAVGLKPEHLAYVIYTSGSTGRPKGVMVGHGNLTHSTLARKSYYGEYGRFLLISPLSFDSSVAAVFGTLTQAGTLIIASQDQVRDPAALLGLAQAFEAQSFLCVPSLYQQMLEHAVGDARPRALQRVIVAGEACPWDLCARSASLLPHVSLFNEYGPTEATVWASVYRCGDIGSLRSVPIGRPIANTRIYVLDGQGGPVPIGVPGELHIGGAGVARGYLNRPELSAERFVADPFAGAGARMYRTGDLGRWLPDGNLEFLGRNDFQVKVRGFRIELGEIEARLLEYPGVREAVVLAREDGEGEKRLVAYVTATEEGAASAEALRAHLSEGLPEYMVPAAYVGVEAWPLTPNGKLDRRALPEPGGEAFAARAYEAPVGEVEEALAAIWAEVLKVDRVGRQDNFFDLGGHSLLAVKVVSRLRQALDMEIPLGDLFARPGLADFARGLEGGARVVLPSILPVAGTGPLPLSFAQQRLWFLTQLEGTGEAYHVPGALRLRGDLDAGALRRALDRIVARHKALRTTFGEVDGEAVQHIAPAEASRFALIEEDLRACSDVEGELERQVAEEARAPFDLEGGPLIRGRLLRVGEEEHALLITLHHIVSDGWSMGVLFRELNALYGAFRRGEGDPLPPLKVQYKDYAAWQRAWMTGEALQRQADFWKGELAGIPELLDLPMDHGRPAQQDHAGAFVEWGLDAELTGRLRALSQRHGTTLFMTLLTAWGILLGRLSGQEDLVVGTPVANRGRAEIEDLIGFFVNTLALRLDLSGSPTVGELLNRVKARALAAQHHQDIPFEQVVEIARPVRSLAHSPVFQVMFAWETAAEGGLDWPGLELSPLGGAPHRTSKFDLTLALGEGAEGIFGGIEYATSLFERETIERYLGYLRQVLEGMVADDTRRVERLALMTESERQRVLVEWNATEAAYPKDLCLQDLVEDQAARRPEAVALVQGERELSYGELNARANGLAHHLRGLGVGPDARVAICAERGLELVVGLLAVLKAGGAYVPLDPAYPAERLKYMVEDAGPVALLTQGELAVNFEGLGGSLPILDLGSEAGVWADRPATNPERGAMGLGPEHLAYVIYTSGSTGAPKGVMVAHRNVVNLVHWHCEAFGLGEGRRSSSVAGVGFDAAVWETWPPLCSGGTLVLPPSEAASNPEALLGWWEAERLDVSFLPTPMAECVFTGGLGNRSLGTLLVGGDRLRHLPREGSSFGVVNNYGPTETTVVATSVRLEGEGEVLPIGRPIANAKVYLLDGQGEPVPIGVRGEIHVGGAGVARGYLNRPELSAERFVADPFAGVGARMYRTGDLGRWLPDGNVEFLGRNDFQVKVRGFRIELGEIEARLLEHPGVREAVVLAREDAEGEKRLVAYVTATEEGAASAEALRAHLSEGLPEYMVPAAYVGVEAWPLTPNGKVDRRALPAPEGEAFAVRAYEAPVGEVEEALAAIWAEVLKVDRVGRQDNFFELGGHSLLAVKVISRLRQALDMEIALGDLFARPGLADFARGIERRPRVELPPITALEGGGWPALSFAQQRLWFLTKLEGARETYHVPGGLRLRGDLDTGALRRALDRIVARHEALRTTFVEIDGEAVQRIASVEEDGFELIEADLRSCLDVEGELERQGVEEARAPFDLERGPLIRGRILRVGEEEHALLITLHHIVSDGWSMGVLMDEMGALYEAFRRGEGDPLPALEVQYKDYAAWQRTWMAGEVLQRQADFWKEHLAGAPEVLDLPVDHARPAHQDYAGAFVEMGLGAELTEGLRALSQRHGTTLYMTLLTGWGILLGRLSGQEDLVVGTPVANRGHLEIEGLIGFFVNTLALRLDLSGSPTVGELLNRVKARALAAQHHQDLPFEQVVEIARPARSLAHSPLFQAMFVWQNAPGGRLELAGLELSPLAGPPHRTSKFDLSLVLGEGTEGIVGGVEYATSLFERGTIERYFGYLRKVLEGMVADDAQRVDRLALMSEEERHRVLVEWNATEEGYPADLCIHELFEAQAAKAPEAVALVQEGRRLSYGELNARANGLAHHLRELGVGPDARVAICVERSFEMVVALLAVLKAGGAYVPLDPAYPAERLKYMVEDAGPVVLLTQGALRERFGDLDVPILGLDSDGGSWAAHPTTNPERAAVGLRPEHLVYVIYTSGSTGTPKGVMVEHGGLVNMVVAQIRGFAVEAGSRTLQFASFSFDACASEVFTTLGRGASLHLAGPGVVLAGETLSRMAAEAGITHVTLPPVVLGTLDEAVDLASVRTLVVAGEALGGALARRWSSGRRMINAYGPTEATVCASMQVGFEAEVQNPPIGRPIANAKVYLLDGQGEPVPIGVPGEIHVGGAGVARGYLNRPELSGERFVADPFAGAGARMYRTGDLGRWLPDGSLEYLGRNDFQVKVRGFRIELGEIEARLLEHPRVREAVVLARDDGEGQKRLVAYYVSPEGEEAGAEALRAHLSEGLPDYMVPAAYVAMEAWPLTPNGKLDRRALPEPEGGAFGARAYEAPEGEIEEALAEIWSEVLKVDRVGRQDDFFDLGGHSLLGTKVVIRIKLKLGIEISLRDVFLKPKLCVLAEQILDARLAQFDPGELASVFESMGTP